MAEAAAGGGGGGEAMDATSSAAAAAESGLVSDGNAGDRACLWFLHWGFWVCSRIRVSVAAAVLNRDALVFLEAC
jgi:hypothetical protein